MVKSIIIAILCFALLVVSAITVVEERTVYYNCDIAEFHPDIPIEVKKRCRELRRPKKII